MLPSLLTVSKFWTCGLTTLTVTAPSYFTQFFEEQIRQNEESGGVRTLYIDRDPETFRDVARHLQGNLTHLTMILIWYSQ